MLKLLGWLIKISIFSLIILVAGNLLRVKGRTISDQVRLQMSAAERSKTAQTLSKDVKDLTHKAGKAWKKATEGDEIQPSERQKLKALIRELNESSQTRSAR